MISASLGAVLARLTILCACALAAGAGYAACPLRSAYDITVTPEALLFDRGSGTARRIEMRNGVLVDRGKAVRLTTADRDRIIRFERTARALVPRIRQVGARAVDLMAVAVREEAVSTSPNAAANPNLNARLEARAAELKSRIARSNTSKEWRGNAFNRYAAEALGDIVPIVGGDLAQQALDATMRGEFSRAAALGERAAGVRASLERRVRAKLDTLHPEMEKLCPALRTLDALESGISAPLGDGTRLNLVELGS